MRRTCSTVSCTAGIRPSAHGFKDRGLDLVGMVRWALGFGSPPWAVCNAISVPAVFQAAMPRCPLDNALASFVQALRNFSTSASVVLQPRLTRTAPRSSGAETPIAARTWDGCTLPEEQAAPEDTATPSRSKAITAVSALIP